MAAAPATLAALVLTAAAAVDTSTPAFGPGEQVTYRVSWLGIPTGSGQVTVGAELPDRPGIWPIVTTGRSDLAIYPMRDKIITYWDPAGARSQGLDLFADENHKRRRQRIDFHPAAGKATVLRQKEGEPIDQKEIAVPPDAIDVASAVFLLRTRRLAVGDEFAFPIFTGAKVFEGRAVVEERGNLDTPLGPQSVVRVRFRTGFAGKLQAQRDLRMWFTDNAAHVPVRMEADFALGTVVVEWTDYKPGRATTPSRLAQDG
jgi:uncharacterized protein DUF3108